jgi:hypothetical protein
VTDTRRAHRAGNPRRGRSCRRKRCCRRKRYDDIGAWSCHARTVDRLPLDTPEIPYTWKMRGSATRLRSDAK